MHTILHFCFLILSFSTGQGLSPDSQFAGALADFIQAERAAAGERADKAVRTFQPGQGAGFSGLPELLAGSSASGTVLDTKFGLLSHPGQHPARRWHRLKAPKWVYRTVLHELATFNRATQPAPARGYPQLTALWVQGQGWAATIYWSDSKDAHPQMRLNKDSRTGRWTFSWRRV